MLVILFISVFENTFVSNQLLSIYHIHSLGHIFTYTSLGLYNKALGLVDVVKEFYANMVKN